MASEREAWEYAESIVEDMSESAILKDAIDLGIIQTKLMEQVTDAVRDHYYQMYWDLEAQYADMNDEDF